MLGEQEGHLLGVELLLGRGAAEGEGGLGRPGLAGGSMLELLLMLLLLQSCLLLLLLQVLLLKQLLLVLLGLGCS